MQTNIFEIMQPRFSFDKDKPITVFEAFSGIGTQRMALERLGVKYEHLACSEIDKHAFNSYNEIFGGEAYNYGDITKIEGWRLAGLDLFTYSFPCTDLSKAGKRKGLNDTRSGLVYEVLRILHEQDYNARPKVLLMENVVDLIQSKFVDQFNEIQDELQELGYSNYVQVLNAKDYGIPQNRKRVFMVSILGNYYYEFPKPIKLDKYLKDYLEPEWEIDKEYYLDNDILKDLIDINNDEKIMVYEATKKGYDIAVAGDSINLDRPNCKTRRGRVGKGIVNTLTTSCNYGVVIDSPTKTIRKLTPRECWRLMGIDDDAFEDAECVCSNSQLYKQAGNAIVVDVLVAIFRELYRGND